MTEPYEQCTLEEGAKTIESITPFLQVFLAQIPPEKESLYISALASFCITHMAIQNQEAVKLFLERAIADIPQLAKIGQKEH